MKDINSINNETRGSKKSFAEELIDENNLPKEKNIKVIFGDEKRKLIEHKNYKSNGISTTRYNIITFIPKSIIMQFNRAANIYFLIICFLTCLELSPKNPISMILTFSFVISMTMLKEAYEDIKRYYSDKENNESKTFKFNQQERRFEMINWDNVRVGDILRIVNNNSIPADLLLINSSLPTGLSFVETINLDGETNLKEMKCPSETKNITEDKLVNFKGEIVCEKSNEFLYKWQATLYSESCSTVLGPKQLLLRGSTLKNTEFIYGVVVYTGHYTKIMKNNKNRPIKKSSVMNLMNKLLYSLFIFQLCVCLFFSLCHLYMDDKYKLKNHLKENQFRHYFKQFLTYLVAYSHLIPISLYVSIEIVKLIQGLLIYYDNFIYDYETGRPANSKTSDLIEELGQVQIIFADKTGTLTRNEMIFKKCSINNKIYTDIAEGSFSIKEILREKLFMENEKKSIIDFFTICCVCHSAFIQKNEKNFEYNSQSPDEISLIQGAAKAGFKYVNKTSEAIEIELESGDFQIWRVILEFPFDNERKRMSVIVQNINSQTDKSFYLFTKGADSEIIKNIKWDILEEKNQVLDKIKGFAIEGLRSLVLVKKKLTEDYLMEILERYQNISISVQSEIEKEKYLIDFYNEVERGFDYVGITAVEDKLQEGVPETIEKFINTNIRVWVLTGDKKETSIEIAKSCNLIKKDMDLIDLTSDFNSVKIDQNFDKVIDERLKEYSSTIHEKKMAIIVDGISLTHILANQDLSNNFINLGLKAHSVICCRVIPIQKALMVRLVREKTNQITLSIGDGANDVGMIWEANIGIGIQGKEGSNAVRSADYSFSQFRFLQRLLFIHGRLGYRKISYFICYYFYKNIILVFTEFYFVFFNGFSGQIFFADVLPLFYNTFWTSWPCIFCYSLEKDVDDEISLSYNILYKAGQINYYFNLKVFWSWVMAAFIHGAINFFSNTMFNKYFIDDSGLTKDHWFFSTLSFTCVIHIVTYKIFIDVLNWNKLTIIISTFSILIYYVSVFIICAPYLFPFVQNSMNSVIYTIIYAFKTLIIIVTLPLFSIFFDLIFRQFTYNFWPSPADIVFRNQDIIKKKIQESILLNQNKEALNYNRQVSMNIDNILNTNSDQNKRFHEIQLIDKS